MEIFRNDGIKVVLNYNLSVTVENKNLIERDDGSFDAFLFGTVVIIDDGEKIIDHKTLTLGTKVNIPIYSKDQIEKVDNDYTTLHFLKGDTFISNRHVIMDIENISAMFKTLTDGHLSKYIPYHMYYDIIMNTIDTNERLGFPTILLELMLGEMFIDENTGEKLRRLGKDIGLPASINDIIQTSGTFNSMTFEDASKSILINLGKDREKQKQESKLEKYFKT